MTAPQRDGMLFPPSSTMWRVNRERVLLLGGPAATILQIAHPHVALGVSEHSDFQNDMEERLRRTLSAVYGITFGTRAEADEVRQRVARAHAPVRGDASRAGMPSARYSAADEDLQRWVLATLIMSSASMFQKFVRPLSLEERQELLGEMIVFGRFFGLREEATPPAWEEFTAYWHGMLDDPQTGSHPLTRALAAAIVRPRKPFVFRAGGWLMRGFVIESIPAKVRERIGIHATAGTRLHARVSTAIIRTALPLLPARVRFVPEYLRALRRIRSNAC